MRADDVMVGTFISNTKHSDISADITHGAEKRPGGRSSRVKLAVLSAVTELLVEKGDKACTIEAVAERSGVHKTTIYRRWGTLGGLMKASFAHMEASPDYLPDTGSLEGDIKRLISVYAQYFESPEGRAVNQLIAGGSEQDNFGRWMGEYYSARRRDFDLIADRAVQRQEIRNRAQFLFCMEMVMGTMLIRTHMTRGRIDDKMVDELYSLSMLYLRSSPR